MLKNIARSLSAQASEIIGFSVLITDQNGIIIGSSDLSRIGTLHEASLEVIRYNRQVFHNEAGAKQLQGTRPGTTLPIILDDEAVGTIGITGTPEEVSRYGKLIKVFAETFIRTEMEKESSAWRNQNRMKLLREILMFDNIENNEEVLISHGKVLGYDLTLPRVAVYFSVCVKPEKNLTGLSYLRDVPYIDSYSIIKQQFRNDQDIGVKLGEDNYLILTAVPADSADYVNMIRERCVELTAQFEQCGFPLFIGFGERSHDVAGLKKTYNNAKLAWKVAKNRYSSGCLYINDFQLEKFIYDIPVNRADSFFEEDLKCIRSQKTTEEIMKMIQIWCESKFNLTEAAKLLNVHKNTLIYRFSRFKTRTGLDLYDFNSAVALYIAILLKQKEK